MIAPKSIVSTNTIAPVAMSTRRIDRGYARPAGRPSRTKENAPSRSRLRPAHPIDRRRSDCLPGVPSTFGAPCSVQSQSYPRFQGRSTHAECLSCANCGIHVYAMTRGIHDLDQCADSSENYRSTQKRTESVSPSSGLPTDRRRSDCRSEGHQPLALRPRCNWETTGRTWLRQGVRELDSRSLRLFLYKPHTLASRRTCST